MGKYSGYLLTVFFQNFENCFEAYACVSIMLQVLRLE